MKVDSWICLIIFGGSLYFTLCDSDSLEISAARTLIWGPGLYANAVLPARYFYIQPVDINGNNITKSLGDYPFSIYLDSEGHTKVRCWIQQLPRPDGSYIVRYKIYKSFTNLRLMVQYQEQHVARAPYMLKGDVHHEECYCPNPSLHNWYAAMSCPDHYEQIASDLAQFPDVIDMATVVKDAVSRFNQAGSHSICHYVVKDNQVYRTCYGKHVGFNMFMDAILLSLTRKTYLPDIEFISNLGDWPLEKRKSGNILPIFSWCGSSESRDIVMPTYDITESTLQTMGRVSLDTLIVQSHNSRSWSNKSDLAFWRGRDSRQERLELVKISRKHPEIIDAKLTNMFFFPKNEELYGEIVKAISFLDFFDHKYQISIDGTVAAYRIPYLMGGGSLILKQDSQFYEHFYSQLQPYVHYVPIRADVTDVLDKIQWAKDNDDESQKIAKNALQYLQDKLQATEIFCYHVKLFEAFSQRLKDPVTVPEGMELVPQPEKSNDCPCATKNTPREMTQKKEDDSKRDEL